MYESTMIALAVYALAAIISFSVALMIKGIFVMIRSFQNNSSSELPAKNESGS